MIRFLLDTDHVSLQERGYPSLRTRLAALPPDSIAATVLVSNLTLLTRNRQDFIRVPDLSIEDWSLSE